MAAVELDILSAANRNNEVINRRTAVHLFSDNWPVRRWASAWVSEQKTADPADELFEWLETASMDDVIGRLQPSRKTLDITANAVRLGSVSSADLHDPEALEPKAALLASAYTALDTFAVPYLEVEA